MPPPPTCSFHICLLFAGGQKVIRCELSLNNGESWRLAGIKRIEERPNRAGKFWAWVHWEISVPTGDKIDWNLLDTS